MFEETLQRQIFSQNKEKTYIDKLLARGEVDRVKELVRKERLSRSEILELLYMCLGTESKLVNLSTWDRYIVLKFFVWIREFIKIAEIMHDYQDDLDKKEREGLIKISKRTKQILANNERLIEHNAKFLIDLYFNILRTTLSVGGTGFLEILKNKYEINYPQNNVATPLEKNKGFLGGEK
jgi:hypothetical protein